MFFDLKRNGYNDVVGRSVYCATINTTDDDVDISVIFLKNGKIVNGSNSLWFYNSNSKNGEVSTTCSPFLCRFDGHNIGFHLNGVYDSSIHDSDESSMISGILTKLCIRKGSAVFLDTDWHNYIDADEVTFVICSKNSFHYSNIEGRLIKFDNFRSNSCGEILSESFISKNYPNAVSAQMFSIFSNNNVENIYRASRVALLQDYVKAVS